MKKLTLLTLGLSAGLSLVSAAHSEIIYSEWMEAGSTTIKVSQVPFMNSTKDMVERMCPIQVDQMVKKGRKIIAYRTRQDTSQNWTSDTTCQIQEIISAPQEK